MLRALPASKRFQDPFGREPWIGDEDDCRLGLVCQAAWRALHGLDWDLSAENEKDSVVLAGWANLCERTGRLSEADQLRSPLPGSFELDYAEQLGPDDPAYSMWVARGHERAEERKTERERTRALQVLWDAGGLQQVVSAANTVELLELAKLLDPSDDWDGIELRVQKMIPSSYKIRLLLLLGRARRLQSQPVEAENIFRSVPQVHPQPVRVSGGDPIPPFHRPTDILGVAETLLHCLDPDRPEPTLIHYLLELPTSPIQVNGLIDQGNWPRTLAHFQGSNRFHIEMLISRYAEFPGSGRLATAHLAWLHPQHIREFETLLV